MSKPPMQDNVTRAQEIAFAWRSVGAHALARDLIDILRSEGQSEELQKHVAVLVLSTEGDPSADDIAHALRA